MLKRKKINWLLVLQAWAMLWVVVGHAFLGKYRGGPEWETLLCNFAYSFHMQLFMLVSGYLFYMTRMAPNRPSGGNLWQYKDIVIDKMKRLLLPGIVFTIIAFVIKVAVPGEVNRQTGFNMQEIVHWIFYPYDNPFREMWFIATLFIFFLFTPLWRVVIKNIYTMWVTVFILALLYFVRPETQFLSINKVCMHAIWFYMGIIISKADVVEKEISQHTWMVLLAGVVIYAIGLFTHKVLLTIGGITFSIALAMLLDKYIPKIFFTFRNYTYQIFLMGIFAQMFVKILYRHISMPYVAAYILCILMGLYVPVIVSKLIEKINWKPLSLCVGLKPVKK